MVPHLAITAAAALIAARTLSPVELTQACLDRIEKTEPARSDKIAAFCQTTTAGSAGLHGQEPSPSSTSVAPPSTTVSPPSSGPPVSTGPPASTGPGGHGQGGPPTTTG